MMRVTETPTQHELETWWNGMHSDDLTVAFSDAFPSTLEVFCTEVRQGAKRLFLSFVDDDIAGAFWLYALGRVEVPRWVGAYVFPEHRIYSAWLAAGVIEYANVSKIYAAVHEENIASQIFTIRMGFTKAGYIPRFSYFKGQLTASYIYARYLGDVEEAMKVAQGHALRIQTSVGIEQTSGVRSLHKCQ